jgi:hypothetical protein
MGISVLLGIAVLAIPSGAVGATRTYVGSLADVSKPTATFTFTALGKVNRKGAFKARRVKGFKASQVPYTCETPTHEVTTTRRSDLPWVSIGLLSVDKRGGFSGQFKPGTDSSFQITGGFHKGKASGSLLGFEGTPGLSTTCTTSMHRWTARGIQPVCSRSAAPAGARPECAGPPRP